MPGVLLGLTDGAVFAGPMVAIVGLALVLQPQRRSAAAAVIGVFVAWYAIAEVLISAGAFRAPVVGPIPALGLVGIPLAAGILVVWLARAVRRLLATPGLPAALVALQTYRVVGGAFLLLMALHRLPPLFALPAGVGDVAIGLSAWSVANALRGGRLSRVVTWNVVGLIDLVVAVGLGVAASPAFHVSPGGVTTLALTTMPAALVPAFLVPLSILLHVASLRSLLLPAVRDLRPVRSPHAAWVARRGAA
jgi:hypothetical protein